VKAECGKWFGVGWATPCVAALALAWPSAACAEPAAATPAPPPDKIQRLGIAGGLALGQSYTMSATLATGALLLCWADPNGPYCGLDHAREAWFELYIPVAGPFVAMHHEEVRENWKYMVGFGALGVSQSVGLSLVAVALWPREQSTAGARGWVVTPAIDGTSQRLLLGGHF
jgi:hypothetical protein